MPLTGDELRSLAWIARIATRVAIPAAHIEKLLDAGYVHEGVSGPALTDLGALILEREARKNGGPK